MITLIYVLTVVLLGLDSWLIYEVIKGNKEFKKGMK